MEENREYFRAISGYSNYEISSHGQVRNTISNLIMKPAIDKDGYKRVALYRNGEISAYRIHRLVAGAFIENINDKPLVDHIDGNVSNNIVTNLRWCSMSENNRSRKSVTGSASSYKGVYKSGRKWRARIKVNGKSLGYGTYDNEKDAAIAYNEAATHHFGEFAKLNVIPDE